jgi:hypothetical protein
VIEIEIIVLNGPMVALFLRCAALTMRVLDPDGREVHSAGWRPFRLTGQSGADRIICSTCQCLPYHLDPHPH